MIAVEEHPYSACNAKQRNQSEENKSIDAKIIDLIVVDLQKGEHQGHAQMLKQPCSHYLFVGGGFYAFLLELT